MLAALKAFAAVSNAFAKQATGASLLVVAVATTIISVG
jgi:hypothetical protein